MDVALFIFASLSVLVTGVVHGPEDYCMVDTFEPSCIKDEVVIIETATYGRMKPGKCFPPEQGNFGCSADVHQILDSLCSGRETCAVKVVHQDLLFTQPCGEAFGYLSVSYSCQKVHDVKSRCQSNSEVTITDSSGYLSTGPTSHDTRPICTVAITVPEGRLVKFTLYNFLKKSGSACYEVAVIKQKDNQKSIHICQSDPRTKEVMMTSASHVTVEFSDFQMGESVGSFLLYYEASGCAKPAIPQNSYLERDGDRAKIVCNDSDKSWFIYCKNNKWTKHDRTCPEGIFLTSFIGVGIGIFLGGFLLFLAVNAFQRHQRRLRQMYEAPPVIPDPDYKIYDTSKMDFTLVPGFATGRHTIPRHQMSPPPIPSQPPEDERRFSRHTYEKPKYNATDNQPFMEA